MGPIHVSQLLVIGKPEIANNLATNRKKAKTVKEATVNRVLDGSTYLG
jgi:hypothetical protein